MQTDTQYVEILGVSVYVGYSQRHFRDIPEVTSCSGYGRIDPSGMVAPLSDFRARAVIGGRAASHDVIASRRPGGQWRCSGVA